MDCWPKMVNPLSHKFHRRRDAKEIRQPQLAAVRCVARLRTPCATDSDAELEPIPHARIPIEMVDESNGAARLPAAFLPPAPGVCSGRRISISIRPIRSGRARTGPLIPPARSAAPSAPRLAGPWWAVSSRTRYRLRWGARSALSRPGRVRIGHDRSGDWRGGRQVENLQRSERVFAAGGRE